MRYETYLHSQHAADDPIGRLDLTPSPPRLTCAALAIGMRCLPHSKLTLAKGNVLHDWHAEVLVIRAFNRWLVDACADLAREGMRGLSMSG